VKEDEMNPRGVTSQQGNRINRRRLLQAAGATGLALGAGSGLSRSTAAQQTTLTFLRHEHPPANNLEKDLIQQYEQANPNIKINYVIVPDVDLFTKFQAMTVAGTPPDIVKRLNADMVRILHSPEVKDRITKAGVDVVAGTPEHFSGYLKSEVARWAKVIQEAGIKAD
jgi:hypothetical protein